MPKTAFAGDGTTGMSFIPAQASLPSSTCKMLVYNQIFQRRASQPFVGLVIPIEFRLDRYPTSCRSKPLLQQNSR
jgi:hypothetical protein